MEAPCADERAGGELGLGSVTRSPPGVRAAPPPVARRRARCAVGARLLGAADARSAERCPLATRADAPDAAHRREAESARLRAKGVDGGNGLAETPGPMVDGLAGLQSQARPAACGAARTEVKGRVGDEAGREDASHGRRCTQAVSPTRASPDRALPAP